MNIAQIVEVLPLQVYVRRGELVIHFSTPADLVSRLAETSGALAELDRQAEAARLEGKAERLGRRGTGRASSGAAAPCEVERELLSPSEPDAPTNSG